VVEASFVVELPALTVLVEEVAMAVSPAIFVPELSSFSIEANGPFPMLLLPSFVTGFVVEVVDDVAVVCPPTSVITLPPLEGLLAVFLPSSFVTAIAVSAVVVVIADVVVADASTRLASVVELSLFPDRDAGLPPELFQSRKDYPM